MIIFLEKLFDQDRCKHLSHVLLNKFNENKLSSESSNEHYGNSYGSTIDEFEKILYELTPLIREKTNIENIKEENSYSRIYFNDSILKSHVDRKGLDLTLSVCLFNNTNIEWPLSVEHEGKVIDVVTNIGDGALILGTKMKHWRERLICDSTQMIMQCFFHWSIK